MNEIVGSKGKITFSTFGNEPIVLTTEVEQSNGALNPQHVHQPLVETIVADLTGDSGQCPSTGVTGARTNWVMEEIK